MRFETKASTCVYIYEFSTPDCNTYCSICNILSKPMKAANSDGSLWVVCVFVYICTCTCVTCIHGHVCLCVIVLVYMGRCMFVCVCCAVCMVCVVCVYMHVCVCMWCACVHACRCVCVCECVHTHVHEYMCFLCVHNSQKKVNRIYTITCFMYLLLFWGCISRVKLEGLLGTDQRREPP